jgi:rhodanese-related sulfurtransferase
MPWGKFLALTLAGAALWGVVAVGAGVVFHAQIDLVLRQLDAFGWGTAAVIAAALALYVAWRWVQRRRAARALEVPRIDVQALRTMIAAGELPIVVDVRGPALQRADARQIPGAIALSLEEVETALREVPRDRPIVLYCACPNEASAARAAQLLLARGYARARPLLGGLDAWIVAGYPIESDHSDDPGGNRRASSRGSATAPELERRE